MVKVGLIGCGAVAGYGHLPAIGSISDLALFAVCDPDPDRLAQARTKYGVPHAFADAASFFDSGIEAVSITSPAPCHLPHVLEAARRGLPVICEKPLAMDRGEAQQMIAAMERAGAPLHTAFCYRFSANALTIRDLVRTRAIGAVRSLRLVYNWNGHGKYAVGPDGDRIIQKRREGRMLEGGPMVDCGTHQIDLALFWLGSEVVRFSGHGAWVDDYEAPDHMWLHMDHANGAHTLVEISYSYHHTSKHPRSEFVYELIGTDGVIRYDRNARQFALENATGSQAFDFHGEKDFARMYREWADFLHGKPSGLLPSADEGMRVIEIAREATNQAIRGRPGAGSA